MEYSRRIPSFIRVKPVSDQTYYEVRERLDSLKLNTVCKEAKCPNIVECWSMGTATIMLLGEVCTRACRFCNVKTGNPRGSIDRSEPLRVARQVRDSNLSYVVLTCVDRDDLEDGGAFLFSETIQKIKEEAPNVRVEGLISDYGGREESLLHLVSSPADVLAHNLESVRSLTPKVRDPRASYEGSLTVLRRMKKMKPQLLTKTSLMTGFGESMEELKEATRDIRQAGVDIITYGQYLRPSEKHLEVARYYTPTEFQELESFARGLGFLYVASGPLVRSSYRAGELFLKQHLEKRG